MARLAQSADEVRRAQQLRFEVFNLELGEGLAESYVTGVDIDPFDEFSDHLMVEELATSEIVGTISRGHKLGRHDGVAIQSALLDQPCNFVVLSLQPRFNMHSTTVQLLMKSVTGET